MAQQLPVDLEDNFFAALDLPLNLKGNKHNQFHPVLTEMRAKCVAQARDLTVLLNPVAAAGKEQAVVTALCPRQIQLSGRIGSNLALGLQAFGAV